MFFSFCPFYAKVWLLRRRCSTNTNRVHASNCCCARLHRHDTDQSTCGRWSGSHHWTNTIALTHRFHFTSVTPVRCPSGLPLVGNSWGRVERGLEPTAHVPPTKTDFGDACPQRLCSVGFDDAYGDKFLPNLPNRFYLLNTNTTVLNNSTSRAADGAVGVISKAPPLIFRH